jgi:hypothetical protein
MFAQAYGNSPIKSKPYTSFINMSSGMYYALPSSRVISRFKVKASRLSFFTTSQYPYNEISAVRFKLYVWLSAYGIQIRCYFRILKN